MPTFLLIGIPIAVALLLWAILSLPDDEQEVNEDVVVDDKPKTIATKSPKKSTKKKSK